MSESKVPQGRCADVAVDGLAGYANYFPHCYWADHCKSEGCFWRRFHQLDESDAAPKQGELNL